MALILIDQFVLNNSIAQFHQSGFTLVGVMTGAGAGLQKLLWNVAGASQSIMAAHFPYSQESLEKYLDLDFKDPMPKFVSQDMAHLMADVAKIDCIVLSRRRKKTEPFTDESKQIENKSLGLGITAAVTTNRQRKGDNKAYINLAGSLKSVYAEIIFTKGILSREEEGEIIDLVALNMLLSHCGFKSSNIGIQLDEKYNIPFTLVINDKFINPNNLSVKSNSSEIIYNYEF